jgi:signal peptidase I
VDDQRDEEMMATDPALGSELEYRGETRTRRTDVAVLLAFLCPGLAYMYVGNLLRAVTVNLLCLAVVEAFIIAQSWMKFFPLLPGLVLVVGWFVVAGLVALDVVDQIRQGEEAHEYVLKSYNHWVFYVVFGVFTMFVPLLLSLQLVLGGVWLAVPIGHDGMFPTLWRGDVVLVDRHGWGGRDPELGELVAVGPEREGGPVFVLRVVAKAGEKVMFADGQLYVGEEAVPQRLVSEQELGDLELDERMTAVVEQVGERVYPVMLARRGGVETTVPLTIVGESGLFLLTDNRGQLELTKGGQRVWDSRDTGSIDLAKVKGQPRYVLWSRDPSSGAVRWDRIGLRLDVQSAERVGEGDKPTKPVKFGVVESSPMWRAGR